MMEANKAVAASAKNIADWPGEGLETVSCCPACGAYKRSLLYEGLTDQVFFCAPGHWTMYLCQSCHSAYLAPRPTPQTIHLAYQTYYTHAIPRRTATGELSPLRGLVRALANGYRNWRYGGDLHPAIRTGAMLARLLPTYRQALDQEMRYLPPVFAGGRLLDIGFGSGAFLEVAARIGWTVTGVDPDSAAVESARKRGLDVYQGGIEAIADQNQRFDVITLSHVIEHVHDPVRALDLAFRLLNPGGCLYLDTPNIEAAGHKEFGRHWRGLEVPRHLAIFSRAALERILMQVGFVDFSYQQRRDMYPSLAAASRAIREGKDPYQHKKPRLRDKIKNTLFNIRPDASCQNSEFITLLAYKPNERASGLS